MQGQKLHILIIPGDELNSNNLCSSIFEIQQATALFKQGINVGFLSLKILPSFRTIIKENLISPFRLIKAFWSRLIINNSYISKGKIMGLDFIEATGSMKYPSKIITSQTKIIKSGLLGFEKYEKLYGKPDLIHAHSRFLLGPFLAYHIKQNFNIPYVVTEHSTLYARGNVYDTDINSVRMVLNNAESWIAVSKDLGLLIQEKIGGLKKAFIEIPNILDMEIEKENPHYEKRITASRFLNIAYLNQKKRHDLLIKAFEVCSIGRKDFALRIGGDGPLRRSLEELINLLKLSDKVILLGKLSRKEVISAIKNCDIFVLPSDYETFGVVLIEALALGKPVIATRCGGPESIITSLNGVIVPKDDMEALADAMTSMAENYEKYDTRKIREDCINKYGSKNVSEKLISVYNQVLKNSN